MAPTKNDRLSRYSDRSGNSVTVAEVENASGIASKGTSKSNTGGCVNESNQIQSETQCPDCGGTDRAFDGGFEYCTNCGVVISDRDLERSEPPWRDTENRRLGPQQSTQWLNTGTSITRDVTGDADKLIRYNQRLTNSERSIVRGLREIRNLTASIEFPEAMRERAAYLYRKGVKDGLLVGRSIDGLAAASVFTAARERKQPTTIDYLAEYSPATASEIRQHLQVMKSELGVTITPAHPRDFLPLIVSRLDLNPTIERRAAQYLEQATANEVHIGKHPAAVAATVIYAAANDVGHKITQQKVADAGDISTVTISRHHQKIRDVLPLSDIEMVYESDIGTFSQ